MHRIGLPLCAFCISALFPSDPFTLGKEKIQWQTGRLVSADLSGHGGKPESAGAQRRGRGDIWWVYCVSSGDKAYSVVSRMSPDKAGLTVNRTVRFSVDRDRIQILNPKGERHTMRIVRQGDESICH